ncbi:MAG: PTS sugar transporter subunit IIC [Erysipelotrichaceae bacterium]|nr:PTS sugar transporter subunit IIC [Erysipelotrichaceae bacterium]MBR0474770.1 PTS sugar transporter subunit IIC [Erysipelotrichaceae bacterium]
MLNALLVYIVVIFSNLANTWFGYTFLSQPIFVGTFVGAVLGDITTGITLGGSLELLFLGAINIGATMPQDSVAGTAIATAMVILLGVDQEAAVALAVPVALLGAQWAPVVLTLESFFNPRVTALCEQAEPKKLHALQYLIIAVHNMAASIHVLLGVALIAASGNSGAVEQFIASLPQWLMTGLSTATGFIPAIGIALILNIIWSNKTAVFYWLGWFLAAYLGIPMLGVAAAGVLYCLVNYNFGRTAAPATVKAAGGEEDLFDE